MAKRRSAQIIRVPQFQARPQIIQVASPTRRRSSGGSRKPKRRHHRRAGASTGRTMMGAAIGGAVFGFVEKSFPTLPTLPFLGRAGTVALVCYFLNKKGGMGGSIIRDTGLAAASIAGYELGKDGKISGDDVDGIPAQVRGVSSQV
jgi:hypothetical protein